MDARLGMLLLCDVLSESIVLSFIVCVRVIYRNDVGLVDCTDIDRQFGKKT